MTQSTQSGVRIVLPRPSRRPADRRSRRGHLSVRRCRPTPSSTPRAALAASPPSATAWPKLWTRCPSTTSGRWRLRPGRNFRHPGRASSASGWRRSPRATQPRGLFNSGSEVTEGAVKLARQYWQARGPAGKIPGDFALAGLPRHDARGERLRRPHRSAAATSAPILTTCPRSPPAYAYRCADCATGSLRCADELERMIRWQGPENVACFIAEPVVGATMGGCRPRRLLPAHPRNLRPLRRAVHRRRSDDRLRAAPGAGSPWSTGTWCPTSWWRRRA